MSLLLYYVSQNTSESQSRFKGYENKFHLILGKTAKSHLQKAPWNGRNGGNYLCKQSTRKCDRIQEKLEYWIQEMEGL